MTDLTGMGLQPPTMRVLGVLVLLGALNLAASFQCPRVSNQALIPDPNDCRRYYHCLTDGRFFIKSCPNGLVFEPKTKVCVWDSYRSCVPQAREDKDKDNVIIPVAMKAATTTEKDTTSAEKETTTVQKKTTTVKKTSATSKATAPISGSKTTESEKSEETTTVNFSTETSSENVTLSANTTDMRASKNPTNGDDSTAATTDKKASPEHFKTSKKEHIIVKRSPFEDNTINSEGTKIECRHAFSYVADPDNCHTFYHCNNWRPFQKRCPPGLFFDSQNLVCNWPHNVNCIEGYRAKTYFAFNGMRRRVFPQNTIKKIKTIVESATDKIPFLETIENDVKKIKYEEDTDSTTSQATRRVTARSFGRWKKRTLAPETSSVYETTQEQTTPEPTTESTVAPSTSTDSLMYETHPSESRSTWQGWNFDLFYTGNKRHGTDLDKLEVFSNGKKVQSEKSADGADVASDTTTAATSPVSTESSSASSQEEISTTAENASVSDVSNTTEVPSTESTAADTTEATNVSTTSDKTTVDNSDVTTTQPEETSVSGSTRTSSFDFGSDEDRERSHPRKLDHDIPPSNPFLTSDRIAANQQSMYARDYHNVEDVEIEKFMMKILNDAMQSKHMVARDANDDNLVDESYDKSKKEAKPEMGGSDVVDKWEIADREGKKTKGTLVEEVTETVVDEVESSGDAEESFDNEPHMTNLIMRDEGKPSDPEEKTTTTPVTESPKVENKTESDNVTEVVTADESSDNATVADDTTTAADNATNTTTHATTTSAAPSTTTESGNTTTTEKVTKTTTTAGTKLVNTTESESVTSESIPVKAVPLLKDMSDLCTDNNNCTIKNDTDTKTTTTTVSSSSTTTTTKATKASSTESTTTLKDELTTTVQAETNTTAAEVETTTAAQSSNATETITKKAEAVETSSVAENVTESQPPTTVAISKEAAGKVDGVFKAIDDNAITKDDKESEVDDAHLPLSENATKTEEATTVSEEKDGNVTESTSVSPTSEEPEVVTNSTKVESEVNTTMTSTVDSNIQTNVTAETESSEESSEEADDSSEVSEVTSTSTLTSVVMETSPSNGKTLTGGKGTTKKSFISLSDLIKWYLRHWRHYSRWRDSKEIKSVEE